MNYIKHKVTEMEDMFQYCIFCGTVISDYRGCIWPTNQEPPKGFPEGDIYVSSGHFPRVTTTIIDSDNDKVIICINK